MEGEKIAVKKILSILIISIMLVTSIIAIADDSSELTWGMSKKEVEKALDSTGIDAMNDATSGGYDTLSFENQKISKFDDALLVCYFANDALCMKLYAINNARKAVVYDYIEKALENKYGSSDKDVDTCIRLLELNGVQGIDESSVKYLEKEDIITYATWKTEKDEKICLIHLNAGDTPMVNLIYFAPDSEVQEIKYDDSGL